MGGGRAAATMAATLFLAAVLMASVALLTVAPPSSSSPSRANGLFSVWTKQQQGLREMGGAGEGRLGEGAYRRVTPRRQTSLALKAHGGGGGVDARVVPRLFPLASAKRQVPTGADPIHHNERPPSLPHRRPHFP